MPRLTWRGIPVTVDLIGQGDNVDMYISMWGAISWLLFVAAVFILIGGAIGYFTAMKDQEAKQQKALDNSAVVPYFKIEENE